MLIQLCANEGEYVELIPQYLTIKSIQTIITSLCVHEKEL